MRLAATLPITIALAFGAGLVAAPHMARLLPEAHAQAPVQSPSAAAATPAPMATPAGGPTAALTAMVVDVAAIKDADLNGTPGLDIRSKPYVVTENATVAVQMGNVGKHYHAKSDEIQYIVEGSGTMWLGDKRVDIRPGMMLIIPKGTNHAGTEATTGRFKAIAIKIPPQAAGDTNFVQ